MTTVAETGHQPHPDGCGTTVPVRPATASAKGTLRGILADVGHDGRRTAMASVILKFRRSELPSMSVAVTALAAGIHESVRGK